MGEEKTDETSGEPGSLSVESAVSHSPDAQNEPVAASAREQGQQDAAADKPKADMPEPDAAKAGESHIAGKVIVMPAGDRFWGKGAGSEPEAGERQGMFEKRRFAAMAAVVALATVSGALGGALATAALIHGADIANDDHALEASVARIDADISALKSGLENNAKLGVNLFNRTSDRLDKIEKVQAEPSAKLAKLSEAVDKLRAAPAPLPSPVAAAPASARDVTGSVSPQAAPKTEVGRPPTVEGWVLRDVANGGALIDGRHGIYEVYAGDSVPGLGRIDAIRRQDGRWVVVTSKGLIVAR